MSLPNLASSLRVVRNTYRIDGSEIEVMQKSNADPRTEPINSLESIIAKYSASNMSDCSTTRRCVSLCRLWRVHVILSYRRLQATSRRIRIRKGIRRTYQKVGPRGSCAMSLAIVSRSSSPAVPGYTTWSVRWTAANAGLHSSSRPRNPSLNSSDNFRRGTRLSRRASVA